MSAKICKKCGLEKSEFRKTYNRDKSKMWESHICLDCTKAERKAYANKNKKHINARMRNYKKNNQELIKKIKKKYYDQNRDKVIESVKRYYTNNSDKKKKYNKIYIENNKEEVRKNHKKYILNNKEDLLYKQRQHYKNSPSKRIRKILSSKIRQYLIKNSSSKNGKSILKHLSYSMEKLKLHLESQFEPWMNWENHGTYKINEWNDQDQTTWKWQIDHIIPHSKFHYISMEDEEFRKCWCLNNLRPLNAKQNLCDGNRRGLND